MNDKTPSHYAAGVALDALDLMAIADQELARAFCVGSILKYVMRAGLKERESVTADLRKALHYGQVAGFHPRRREAASQWSTLTSEARRGLILREILVGWSEPVPADITECRISRALGMVSMWLEAEGETP